MIFWLLACAPVELGDPCIGDGDVSLRLGEGGETDFLAWQDGDTVQVAQAASGEWRLQVAARSTGLDTQESVVAVYRLETERAGTLDFAQGPYLSCDGTAGYTQAVLGATDSPVGPATLSLTLTDVIGDSVTETVELDLVEAS